MIAAMTGEVDFAIGFGATAMPLIRSGKLRVLAVVEGKPFAGMQYVPLLKEILPAVKAPPSWLGLFAPAGLPAQLSERLRSGVVAALQLPEIQSRTGDEGLEVVGNSPLEFSAQIKKQIELIGRIAQTAQIKQVGP